MHAGAKEFWITSQDTACYGRDLGTDLAELLAAIGGLTRGFSGSGWHDDAKLGY